MVTVLQNFVTYDHVWLCRGGFNANRDVIMVADDLMNHLYLMSICHSFLGIQKGEEKKKVGNKNNRELLYDLETEKKKKAILVRYPSSYIFSFDMPLDNLCRFKKRHRKFGMTPSPILSSHLPSMVA